MIDAIDPGMILHDFNATLAWLKDQPTTFHTRDHWLFDVTLEQVDADQQTRSPRALETHGEAPE